MRQYFRELKDFFRKGDLVLLLLCLITSAFGVIMISSAKNYTGSLRFVIIQVAAIAIGVLAYMIVSAIDADFMSEHRMLLVGFNTFLLLLLIPFAVK